MRQKDFSSSSQDLLKTSSLDLKLGYEKSLRERRFPVRWAKK